MHSLAEQLVAVSPEIDLVDLSRLVADGSCSRQLPVWKTPARDKDASRRPWILTAWLQEEGDDEHKRLDPAALQDIVIVCHYTCS
jgi:hypothetical protein